MSQTVETDFATLRQAMVEAIAAYALLSSEHTNKECFDQRVMETMAKVPRHTYVPVELQHVAYANIPWFMVKALAGLYTGKMMGRFCPAEGVQNTETMWLIYALVAMISPVGLVIAQKWVRKGLHKMPGETTS